MFPPKCIWNNFFLDYYIELTVSTPNSYGVNEISIWLISFIQL